MASETRQAATAPPGVPAPSTGTAGAPAGAAATAPPGAGASPTNWASWRYLWQAPAIVVSLALIIIGVRSGAGPAPVHDFDGAMDQIEQWLVQGELESVQHRFSEAIEPNLALATLPQRARFHALVADWVALTQAASHTTAAENNRRIAEQYSQAVAFGHGLSAAQIERWAEALVDLQDARGSQQRIAELEAMAAAGGESGADARVRRNRVLRRLVESSLRQPDRSYDELLQQLTEFRADRLLSADDEIWAVARQAELRLEAGLVEQAVDRMLVDMRRLEPQLTDADAQSVGELYVLLGRAYFNLGKYDAAVYQLNRAVELFAGPVALKGEALVLLGSINQVAGMYSDAYDVYDEVVRDYAATPAFLAALLGRAEVLGIMGEHQRSLADYQQVCQELPRAEPRRDLTPLRVARSLADRHDAALTSGMLDTALAYVIPAEGLFPSADVPAEILLRIASTSRQLADTIEASALGHSGTGSSEGPSASTPWGDDHARRVADRQSLDPAVIQEAHLHYRRAAEYAVRHARAVAASPSIDSQWSDSLWMGADSYDMAGWHDKAALHFKEYLAGTSESDPRRAEAMFRLAQAYQADAQGNYGPALSAYEQLISEYPRSPYATRGYVPLAVCYMASDRRTEAEQQLLAVLKGERLLKPDAADFREAQLALGRLYYESGEHLAAIEQLDAAVRRYPEDPRIRQTLFYLADAYRNHAAQLKQTIEQPTTTRGEREQLVDQRRQHLLLAGGLFDQVIERYETLPEARLDNLQREQLRLAHLYRGDAAFDLAQYDKAIELYDYAARKYAAHHCSMVALVQIVNCYHLLGDVERARTAHARALVRLEQLPPTAFDAPDAIMNRAAWEDWLRNSPLGHPRVAGAGGAASEGGGT